MKESLAISLRTLGEEWNKKAKGHLATLHWPPCHAQVEHTSGNLCDDNSGGKAVAEAILHVAELILQVEIFVKPHYLLTIVNLRYKY